MTPEFDENGEVIWRSPVVSVEINGQTEQLTYENTRLRIFSDQWAYLNHIEWINKNGELGGYMAPAEIFNNLIDKNFPHDFTPIPTDEDKDWYVTGQMQSIDLEIDYLEGE